MAVSTTPPKAGLRGRLGRCTPFWPLLLGLAALYVPTFHDLAFGLWSNESYAHGPIILVLALWLLWGAGPAAAAASRGGQPLLGAPLVLFALVLYVLGRSQSVQSFELGSFIVLLAGLLVYFWGTGAFVRLWFPFFFMLFMIPLPGSLVSLLTLPMKMAVSYVTEQALFLVGYPIARSGVILQIGQYQLLVADACAGLQTLLTLEALGLFYLNVVRHTAALRNIVLAALIIPISFTANVIRVITLTLITYYFGDAAGQGFLHGFAGMLLFISALMLIICVDSMLQWLVGMRARRGAVAVGAKEAA
jgi:exosortase B